MRNSYKNITERRKEILQLLKKHNTMSITELSQNLGVSEMTVRRDCNVLSTRSEVSQKMGIIRLTSREVVGPNEREKIKSHLGLEAAKLIHDNDIVFVNSSTTAMYSVPQVLQKKTFVVTNNGGAVKHLTDDVNGTLILSGGNASKFGIMSGDIANHTFLSMRSDWGIIGCAGISFDQGISTPSIEEATVNRNIVKNSRKLMLLADHTKFGVFSNFTIANITDIDLLITDTFVPDKILYQFKKKGIEVIQVP
ncbi:DeoR/GlpR family DNA-binding transcription regulator [Furfurilactobacillus rossiae]|uniref:Transcriptional regulator n=1 Tax=Furfurilactobacillus rossiae DSM 15814 TaxID=1114972 RepID=A0A0R1RUS3_9LACO|nr:DeoR/GlpR family DNA-binding transcription regulator [Furfurilactobacillus rossiae]KRL56891.1 transcriptional regulator [Furfurilactobacillus rossiae DSM 15814]QFR67080.1 DeoR family transcriptional regulator [Furfurilactobacillus rossiae]QLE62585.1 regulatory protein DeoR [Furfurilactobacillus rossiae]